MESYAPVIGWTQDFVRAMGDRPLWARLLFRLAAGRYAYREYIGLMIALKEHNDPLDDYSLEGVSYQKDKTPLDYKRVIDNPLN